MREIKFRALIDGKWYYFGLFDISADGRVIKDGGDLTQAEVIVQYIGLKDKNGKEIYEGDILKPIVLSSWSKQNFLVEKRCLCFGFKGLKRFANKTVEYSWDTITNEDMKQINSLEVIGNTYENPELKEEEV